MKKLLFVALVACTMFGRLEAAPISCAGSPGSVADAAGDAVGLGAPDITCAAAQAGGGNLMLSIAFAPGTFDPATSRVGFGLDTDQNPATGFPGIDSANNDSAIFGLDFLVTFGSASEGGAARVRQAPGFGLVGNGTVQFFDDGMLATIPLALLAGDDGILNFKATVQTQLGANTFTTIQDYVTDIGALPGTSALVPEPATLALIGIGLAGLGFSRRKRAAQ